MDSNEFRKIVCQKCGWSTLLNSDGIRQWLVRHGKFGPNHDAEDEILYELFYANVGQYHCPDCYSTRLEISTVIDDFSDMEQRRCRGCANVIPRERLEILPETLYCAQCAEKRERGEALDLNVEYCPVCGSVMELVPVGNSFEWRCTRVPSCRFL